MSRRKENIRKACDRIDDIIFDCYELLPAQKRIELLILTRRIKRTTWRNDENKLDKRITDDIKQIAMRSFKNDLSNIKLNNDHAPATDW